MYQYTKQLILFILLCADAGLPAYANTLEFSNFTWEIREKIGNPGNNIWSAKNAWVDKNGWLHLKISHSEGTWFSAGIYTQKNLGFGQYWFYTLGRIDNLDPNIAFAIFNYTTPLIGPDGTNEIDIEFSKWGGPNSWQTLNMSYTVWPNYKELGRTLLFSQVKQHEEKATYGFIWSATKVIFQASDGHDKNFPKPLLTWAFQPPDYAKRIPQSPMPIHLYLNLLHAEPPKNKNEVEVVITKFCFKSFDGTVNNCHY